MGTLTMKELQSQNDIIRAFPIMKQLRTHLDQSTYLALVEDAQEKDNYQMMALFAKDSIVAVVGFKPMITLYYGRFVWVCDLVTDRNKRSMGYGEKMLAYVHKWAHQRGYKTIALSSGLHRTDAHRFYGEKMGYDKVSYVFKKELNEELNEFV